MSNKEIISLIIDEIYKSENSIKYYDKFKKLRRIEKLYNKGVNLINANEKNFVFIKIDISQRIFDF